MRTRLLVTGLAAATVLLPVPAQARTEAPAADLPVTAFAITGTPPRVVSAQAAGIDTVSVAGVGLRRSGDALTPVDRGTRALLDRAERDGLASELIVSNFDNRLGDFRHATAAALLHDAGHRRSVASRLDAIVRRNGWDSVNVDLEVLRRSDADALVTFVRELSDALPDRVDVTVDVGARGSLGSYLASGFRLRPLAKAADRLVLMAYDLHGPTWSAPGPIGPLPWVQKTLDVLRERVPARKVDLGIAGYGYAWTGHREGHTVTVARARALVADDGADRVWHPRAGEWSAELSDGTVLWWSDRRTYPLHVDLAERNGVHGVAVWRLGSADKLG